MRKLRLILSGIILLALSATRSEAQTTMTHYEIDSCYTGSSSTQMIFIVDVTGNGANSLQYIETSFGNGTRDSVNVTGWGNPFSSYTMHTYTAAGTYTVKHVAIRSNGARVDSISFSVQAQCNFIGGNLYHDVNSNCTRNSGEPSLAGIVNIKVDSAGIPVDTIMAYGSFAYKVRSLVSTVYAFTLLNAPAGYTRTCPATNTITYTWNPNQITTPPQNFGFSCSSTPSTDLQLVFSRALRGFTSGGTSYINLYAYNTSCHQTTGTVTLNVSPKYNVTTSGILPTPSSVSGNTIVWTVPSMLAGNYLTMYVPLTPKSTTNNGDTACNIAVITPFSGDVNLANNTVGGCDSVRSSWDPNEKSVSTNGIVQGGSVLNYTIDFENLGNDTAFNIHILDTLSNRLDANSFVLLGSTHQVIPSIQDSYTGAQILKFDFANIRLEDKRAPTRNKGQVRFSIRLRPGSLAPGTTILNRAGIYFDGNPVVLTNYAAVATPKPQSVSPTAWSEQVRIYPNPVSESLQIAVDGAGWNEAVLTNTLGQTMLHTQLERGANVVEIARLPTGIYYLQIRGTNGAFSKKIEKQ